MVEESNNSRILAEAVGGKTARACDGCVKRRARWYCAADDAFLCQSCDVTVHSANSLARRHERVRLKSASFSPKLSSAATWHQGFTRKPRTPRSGGPVKKGDRPAAIHDFVPEIGIENDTENNSEEERLFYQVPEFDPIVSDDSNVKGNGNGNGNVDSCLNGFFPTDKELAEFAADVETLFGNGPENESFAIGELGQRPNSFALKVEAEQSEEALIEHTECYNHGIVEGEPFDMSFNYDSRASFMEEDDEKKVGTVKEEGGKERDADEDDDLRKRKNDNKKDLMLSLDYESVIATWGGQGPPWMAGGPPEIDPDDQNWPACLSVNGEEAQYQYGVAARMQAGFTDEGREARVSRYREKRRTRLFSKKIRYEVRKLNAEKRPRLKGRFVKRSAFTLLSNSK